MSIQQSGCGHAVGSSAEFSRKLQLVVHFHRVIITSQHTFIRYLQIFEASNTVLRRDPGCLLAALCDGGGPLAADSDGTVYVDRDW